MSRITYVGKGKKGKEWVKNFKSHSEQFYGSKGGRFLHPVTQERASQIRPDMKETFNRDNDWDYERIANTGLIKPDFYYFAERDSPVRQIRG